MGTFQDMHSDIDHGPAALQFFLTEYTPVGYAATAESLTFDKHDIAESAFISGTDESSCLVIVTLLEPHSKFDFILFCRCDHFFTFSRIHCHGLFHHSVAAGITGIYNRSAMHTVGGTDIHTIGFDLFQHLFPICEECFFGKFPGFFHNFQTIRIDIHTGNDFHFGHFLISPQMRLGDPAATDNGNSEFFTLELLFGISHFYRNTLCHFPLLIF